MSDQASLAGIYLNPLVKEVVDVCRMESNEITDKIAVLNSKLQYKEQKIHELTKLNEKLKLTNSNLMLKNKQLLNR